MYSGRQDVCSIGEDMFDREAWYLRLALEGEDRLAHNREMKERKKSVSYSASAEELEDVEYTDDVMLDQMVLKETVAEVLSILTGRQRKAIIQFYLCQKTQGQIAEELDVTAPAVSQLISRAVRRMRRGEARV